jgi:thiol-disulfide isomerase/thioredoxin
LGLTLAVVALAMAPTPSLAAEETREQALESLSSGMGELQSWALDYFMLVNAQGMTVPTEGRMEVMGKLIRNEMNVDMLGQSMSVVAITDEEGVTWTESNIFGQKMVMKTEADGTSSGGLGGMAPVSNEALIDPRRILTLVHDREEIEFLGREELEGEEVLSFEMPLDPALQNEVDPTGQLAQLGIKPEKFQAMIGASDGFPRLWQLVDAVGNAVVSVIYRDVQINPELASERFKYTPDENDNVMDLSQLAEGLLGSLGESGDLSSSPELQELLGDLDLQGLDAGSLAEKESDDTKYNTKFEKGDIAPAFKAEDINGKAVELTAAPRTYVLLDFWATWSEPWRNTLPDLADLHAQYEERGLKIIGINLDDNREVVEAFLKEHPEMSWPQVFDGKGWSSEVGTLYGIEAIPHRILIRANGVIEKTGMRGDSLQKSIRKRFPE